jgi:hypothetical protein
MKTLLFQVIGCIAIAVLFYMKGGTDTENRLTAKYQAESIAQTNQTLIANKALHGLIAKSDTQRTEQRFDAEEITDSLLGSVSRGDKRLFVKTTQAKCPVSGDSPAASLGNATSDTELDRDTSQNLIRITARGDKAIIQLGACQDYIRAILK